MDSDAPDPLIVTQVSARVTPSDPPSDGPRTAPVPEPLAALIRVENRPAVPAVYLLRQGSCLIGAGHDMDIVVRDRTVSRVHVELTLVPEGVEVRDCGSHNGTYWLGQRIERVRLGLGSRIRIGETHVSLGVEDPTPGDAEADLASYGALHGASLPMRRTFALLRRLEGSLVTVLLQGEPGVGKTLVARALHEHSRVAAGPLVTLDCASVDRAYLRSELFGYRRGAFAGAATDRAGAFERAAQGTLFLKDVEELPLEVQPLLLGALETGAYQRVGETLERRARVRVLAATRRDLRAEVAAGRLREDLYERLGVVKIVLPPLRERPADVEELGRHYCEWLGLPAPSGQLARQLLSHSWPGNVRELKHALAAYAVLGALPAAPVPSVPAATAELEAGLRRLVDARAPYAEQKERLERVFLRVYIEQLLALTGGDRAEAARLSGLQRGHIERVLNRTREDD